MKKLLAVLIAIGGIVLFVHIKSSFNVDFASDVFLRFSYIDYDISEKVNDDTVIAELKSILQGTLFTEDFLFGLIKGEPSCGFSSEISLTFSNSKKSIVLCPALDGCSTIKVDGTRKYFYTSEKDRKRLNDILSGYGFHFPCV